MSTEERIVADPITLARFVTEGYSEVAASAIREDVAAAMISMHADGRFADAVPGRLELVLRVTREG
jgi:hypothetical protein